MIEILLGVIFGVLVVSMCVGVFIYIEKKLDARKLNKYKRQTAEVREWLESFKESKEQG